MRELKFRAWDKDCQKWCSRVDYDGYTEEWLGVATITSPEEKGRYIGEYVSEPEEIVVEQYTGLKDKNGKDIYEGDMVKFLGDVYKIYFDIVYGWRGKNLRTTYYQTLYDMTINNVDRPQIIGNIHENPELLEGEE